ncbi:hypothetical protein AYO25_05090 [Candidatus Liberibacter solanacearum]|uniref:Uncharacterized protein n=1 Tax=Candidatus Liberibacter solanacearum TaxID=556287 RepID=A0A1V2N6T8_9HYPH|nr:hypothetical protein [Candidatus Liberibacter solanacearum]ONI58414.1 hypothetical protein AYO25_05090 [Candidatus Liberibacter solanacearum]ONI59044.1 hypothetical protein AYJ09_01265 [Candidatus Liberibacter solanacearum]
MPLANESMRLANASLRLEDSSSSVTDSYLFFYLFLLALISAYIREISNVVSQNSSSIVKIPTSSIIHGKEQKGL